MSTTLSPEDHVRGTGLGIAGQACFAGAWLFGLLGAVTQSPIGLAGIVAGVTAIVLSAIAFFLVRRRWGLLGPIAGWILSAGSVGSVILFLAIPGSNEWGKFGALIISMCALGVTFAVSHLIAAIGLLRGGSRAFGIAAVVVQSAGIACALVSAVARADLWFVSAIAAFVGHALLLAGFIAMRRAA